MSQTPHKGLTIFQKIFMAYMAIGLIIVIVSGYINYRSGKAFIQDNARSQGSQFLDAAVNYFDQVYNIPIIEDLNLIAISPALDWLLASKQHEEFITRPDVEKLFLHFTKSYHDKYISLRFIDHKGFERIITQGDKRVRHYRYTDEKPHTQFYSIVRNLYINLKNSDPGTIIYSKPFLYENRKTVLAGISKRDPKISGFGGAVIIHCSLANFEQYVSAIKFNNHSIIQIDAASHETPSAPDYYGPPRLGNRSNERFVTAGFIRVGTDRMKLFSIKTVIPQEAYVVQIKRAFWDSALLALLMMALVVLCAYFLSKKLAYPIKLLLEGTKRITAGDLSTKIDVTTTDEIGLLTLYFNEMVVNLKSSNERLIYEAFHDVLTDLPNRSLLLDRLEMTIRRYQRDPKSMFAILFIDLNRFKLVNDSLGHHTGDILLKQISQRFKQVVRSSDTIGRLGGDEFVILLDQIDSIEEPKGLAERLQEELDKPFMLADQEIYVSCSVGIILSQPGYDEPADYLRDADTAMYSAKASSHTHYRVFDETMRSSVISTMQMEMEIRAAFDQDQFLINYQPIVCLKENRIIRFEALIRWMHPEKGLIYPMEFISNAEETGIIVSLDKWMLRNVCKDIKRWEENGLPPMVFAINFSAKQFVQRGLVKHIKETLTDARVLAESLCIEITETVAMSDVSLSISVLNELHQMGIKISIDDFGIGYSSLNSLKLFPVDHLKIDRQFIADIMINTDKAAIIEAIIVMSHKLGYTVVAEGIETQEQVDFLCKNNCDAGQGYYYAKPAGFKDIAELVKKPLDIN